MEQKLFHRRPFGDCWCEIFMDRMDALLVTQPPVSNWRNNCGCNISHYLFLL